jgi:hypothetical protein
MLRRLFVIATCTLVAGATAFAVPFGDGFAARELSAYLDNAKQLKPNQVALEAAKDLTGKAALRIGEGARAVFKEVPVDADTKYTLTFRGRFDGGEAAEENPHLDQFVAYGGAPLILPARELQFLDADKKPLPGMNAGLPFRNWTEYRDIFYPPAGAKFLRLAIRSGTKGTTLFVDDVKLEPTPDEGSINANPVIGRYGKYNYSGWNAPSAGGKIIETEDGRVAFDTKYGSRSMSFPFPGPGTYAITAKSEGNGYNTSIVLDLLDENGKKLDGISAWGNGRPYKFVLPAAAKRGSFLVYSNLLEELRVTRFTDEGASAKK